MRLSQLFTRTRKEVPADEMARNAQLLIKAGFVHKEMAGVYSYLPLGLKVLENIKAIVREEMNAVGGQEIIMTSLQPKERWQETGRWDDKTVDIWFKTKLKDDTEIGLAWSHEEPIIDMFKQHVNSYKDFPVIAYQFQTKMRNELRSKSGIMRGREFLMKDMYSIARTAKELDEYYNEVMNAYKKVYDRLGIGKDTYITFASGGAFTEFSHEFQTICETGEDKIYLHRGKNIAINEEVMTDANINKLGIKKDELEEVNSSEVGNIFNFGTDKSRSMNFTFTDENGQNKYPYLGSYGIGITRVMGVIAEKMSDDKGLVWPEEIAPAKAIIVQIGDSEAVKKSAEKLYKGLTEAFVEVLYDDRDMRPGEKFADADLMGIPYRIVVSDKTVAKLEYEFKRRTEDTTKLLTETKLLEVLTKRS